MSDIINKIIDNNPIINDNEDEFIAGILRGSTSIKSEILKDCEIALEIMDNYTDDLYHRIYIECFDYIILIDLENITEIFGDVLNKLSDLQWRCKIGHMCHLAETTDPSYSADQVSYFIANRDKVKRVLDNRVNALKSTLYN